MGWRIHRSINVGLGFKINISKSGIGYSWGVPGYRKTRKANGGTRTTYSIPGTGISYVEETNSKNNPPYKLPRSNSMERYNLENTKEYPVINGKIDALSTPENKIFIDRLKSIRLKNLLTWIVGITLLVVFINLLNMIPEDVWTWIFLPIVGIVVALIVLINSRRHIVIEYDIDKDITSLIKQRDEALSYLRSCEKIWNIEQYDQVAYTRVNAGASTNIKRKKVVLSYGKGPKYLKIVNDINLYQLKIDKTRYLFLPDKILVVGFLQVGALRYHDIKITMKDTPFVENSESPNDAIFLHNTWQYVNNNGTPDRRFNNNRQLPVYAYKIIYLNSATGLNVHLMVSSRSKAEMFNQIWNNINDLL